MPIKRERMEFGETMLKYRPFQKSMADQSRFMPFAISLFEPFMRITVKISNP